MRTCQGISPGRSLLCFRPAELNQALLTVSARLSSVASRAASRYSFPSEPRYTASKATSLFSTLRSSRHRKRSSDSATAVRSRTAGPLVGSSRIARITSRLAAKLTIMARTVLLLITSDSRHPGPSESQS